MRRLSLPFLLAAVVALAACQPIPAAPAGWHQGYMTRPGADVQTYTVDGDTLRFSSPPTNIDANTRMVLARDADVVSDDHQSCATARTPGFPTQEGAAARVAVNGARVQAVTVTKNVWGNATWVYNIHQWDTARWPGVGPQLASFDMAAAVGRGDSSTEPRRLCLKVDGRTLTFKVWPATRPEPAWGDPTYTRTYTLPADAVYKGRPGWYMGHLPPGTNADYTQITTALTAVNTPVVK
jgi:hypothetical protein